MKKLLERERHQVIANVLALPLSQVREVVYGLKTADRIPLTRGGSSTWRAKTLARVIFALCAPVAVRAAEVEKALSAAPRLNGETASTAGADLADLLEAALCSAGDQVDWHAPGDLFLDPDGAALFLEYKLVDGDSRCWRYGTPRGDVDGMTRYVRIPLGALRRLALEILEETR